MLEELIQEKEKVIKAKVEEYENLISKTEKEKQFLKMLEKAEKQSSTEIEKLKHKIEAQERAILEYKEFNVFQKLFSKEYRNYRKIKHNIEEEQNQDKNCMNEKIKNTRKIREHIQITRRKIEDRMDELEKYDIDALKGIQKKLEDAQNSLQLGKKPDEVIRHLQDNGIIVDYNKTISKAVTIPKESKYKLSNNMGNLEIKSIAQIWESKQKAGKESAIKGVYSINYDVNGKNSKQSFLDSKNLIVAIVLRTNEKRRKRICVTSKRKLMYHRSEILSDYYLGDA